MNTRFSDILVCPVCGKGFLASTSTSASASASPSGNSMLCRSEGKKHCFDIARSGHVNLLCGRSGGGDDKACAASRTAFLEKGFYKPFSDEINSLLKKYSVRTLLDAGCGEGYYTHRAAAECDLALGIDLSKFAVETAAKRAKREGSTNELYAVAGIFDIPAADSSFDGIINLFAPCGEAEFCRVLKEDGILIIGAAGKDHLLGLKKAIYETAYKNEERADLPRSMPLLEKRTVAFDITLEGQADIQNLFSMTPYFYRTSYEGKEKLSRLTSLTTIAQFDIFVFKNTLKKGEDMFWL